MIDPILNDTIRQLVIANRILAYENVIDLCLLNAVLAFQMIYYWRSPSRKAKGKRKAGLVTAGGSSTATPKKGASTRRRG